MTDVPDQRRDAPQGDPPPRRRDPAPARFGVVIADDVQDMRDLLRWQLRSRRDLRVVGEAITGRQAMYVAASMQPDLMFLDIRMPEMSGLAALSNIRDASPSTRVIMLSGLDDEAEQHEARSLGAAYFLTKGGGRQTVLDAVAAVLGPPLAAVPPA